MYKEVYKQLGLNIKKYRNVCGLTQEQLAEKIDKSLNFVGKIEVAFSHPAFETIVDIARALNVPLKNLFEDVN